MFEAPKVWFWIDLEAWQVMSTRAFDCGMYFVYTFSTQSEDQDQTQEEDKV